MLPINLALTSALPQVGLSDLTRVAAALQQQITSDFAPIWTVTATIGAFAPDQIPAGYWPIHIVTDLGADAGSLGVHHDASDNTPYANVLYGPTWSLTASHEMLEMLADPWCSRKIPGLSLQPGQGQVDFLVEICDPCEDEHFAYAQNGVSVSDFCTPNYYDQTASAGVRYSFRGNVTAPRQVLANGYVCWFDADQNIWRAAADANGTISIVDGGPLTARGIRSPREYVDGLTPDHHHKLSNASLPASVIEAVGAARRGSQTMLRRIKKERERWVRPE